MHRGFRLTAALTALSLLAAAPAGYGTPPAAQPAGITGFHHDARNDVFGFYMPERETTIGKWLLSSINLGTTDEFIAYEKGSRDPPQYAPVMIEFADTTSPQIENEMGGTNYAKQIRVLPTAYSISGNQVQFAGTDPTLGSVTFTGTLDLAAIKAAQNSEGNYDAARVVATGDLVVGTHTLKNLRFTWFGGD